MATIDQLIGTWKVTDDPLNPDEETFYVFNEAGDLTMTFRTKRGTQYILLTYALQGDVLITDQPSAPKIEKTTIQIDREKMTINHNGTITRLEKIRQCA